MIFCFMIDYFLELAPCQVHLVHSKILVQSELVFL